jgi:hypothetical protein
VTTSRAGGCLCGAVRYRLEGDPLASTTCQCRTCRKATASAIVPWLHLDGTKLVYTAGRPAEFQSSPGVTRSFCGRCGTPLTYWTTVYGPNIDVTTASLDDPEAFPPIGHFWTSHRLGWLQLADGLPGVEEGLPSD